MTAREEVNVTVNGDERIVASGTTLADLVRSLGRDPERPGVAVAVNGTVVARGAWERRTIAPGEDIEVVAAVQGGS